MKTAFNLAEHLKALITHGGKSAKMAVAYCDNLPDEICNTLAADTDREVRICVALATNNESALARLAHDKCPVIRHAVANNIHANIETIALLGMDGNREVSDRVCGRWAYETAKAGRESR